MGPPVQRSQRVGDLALVIGPIAIQRLHWGLDSCQQRLDLRDIILAISRRWPHGRLYASLRPTVQTHFPLVFIIYTFSPVEFTTKWID